MKTFLFISSILLLAGHLLAEDWPQFLGPNRNGISAETGLLDKFPESGPKLVWQKQIGTGYSAPSIRDGKLILFHRLAEEEVVECLDAATAKALWRYSYASKFQDPYGYNNGPRCTPLLTQKFCYTFGAEGMLTCLDLQTGRMVWQRNTSREWDIPEAFFGVGSTPVLEGDLLIVMIGGQPNAGVVGLDPKTGKTAWETVGEKNWSGKPMLGFTDSYQQRKPDEKFLLARQAGDETKVQWSPAEKQASYASPVVASIHGKRRLLCLMRQGLVMLDPTTGAVDDSFWYRARVNESVNAANPVVVGDKVLISSSYYRTGSVLLQVNAQQKFEELWRSLVLEIHFTTPILKDGFLYAFSGRNEPDARFRCVDLDSGKLMWDRDEHWSPHSAAQPNVYGRGSAILADGKLIVLGEGGLLGLFKANPGKAEELSRWQVPQLHYPTWAAPVLVEKKIYLRSEDRLVCFDLAK